MNKKVDAMYIGLNVLVLIALICFSYWSCKILIAIDAVVYHLQRIEREAVAMVDELQAINLQAEQHQLDTETMLMLWDK